MLQDVALEPHPLTLRASTQRSPGARGETWGLVRDETKGASMGSLRSLFCLLIGLGVLSVAGAQPATVIVKKNVGGGVVPGPAGGTERLRVIIETDAGGDPDDEQSLVRFLLYANEWDVEGIICTLPRAREKENL